jgi:outer membrane protein assembly factor BamD
MLPRLARPARLARFAPFAPFALAVALGVGGLGVLTGCETPPAKVALSYTADAKRAYERAMEEFDAHNWIEAQTLFRDVKKKYSYSKYARLSDLRLADADFAQEKWTDAIRGYRSFIQVYRSDTEGVSYARSRIAEAQYSEIGDSFLVPSGEERDQASIVDTYRELRGYLSDYPDAKESAKIRGLLADVTARLVRHELYVARFYLDRDNYEAAVLRVQYALRNFSAGAAADSKGTALEPEALVLLGETYLKMHHWQDARTAFTIVLDKFSASPLTAQARNYLDYMKQRGV